MLNNLTTTPWLCVDWSIKLNRTSLNLIPSLDLHIIFVDLFVHVFKLSIHPWFRHTRSQFFIYTEICINSPSQFKHNDVRLQHWLHDSTACVFLASSHMPHHYACHVIASFVIPLSYTLSFLCHSVYWLFLCHYWTPLTSMTTIYNTNIICIYVCMYICVSL